MTADYQPAASTPVNLTLPVALCLARKARHAHVVDQPLMQWADRCIEYRVWQDQASLPKKPVMRCCCGTTLNAGATIGSVTSTSSRAHSAQRVRSRKSTVVCRSDR